MTKKKYCCNPLELNFAFVVFGDRLCFCPLWIESSSYQYVFLYGNDNQRNTLRLKTMISLDSPARRRESSYSLTPTCNRTSISSSHAREQTKKCGSRLYVAICGLGQNMHIATFMATAVVKAKRIFELKLNRFVSCCEVYRDESRVDNRWKNRRNRVIFLKFFHFLVITREKQRIKWTPGNP